MINAKTNKQNCPFRWPNVDFRWNYCFIVLNNIHLSSDKEALVKLVKRPLTSKTGRKKITHKTELQKSNRQLPQHGIYILSAERALI